MTASRRVRFGIIGATALALAAAPLVAQNSDAPIDVTAAPPPSPGTIGPSQLRDFNLNGTVTRPATTDPVRTAPAAAPPVADTVPPAARRAEPPPREAAARPRPLSTDTASTAPLPTLSEPAIDAVVQPSFEPGPGAAVSLPPEPQEFPLWPWLAAALALVAGGAYLVRGRRQQRARYGNFDRLAFAGPEPDVPASPTPVPAPRAAHPMPPATAPAPARAPATDGLVTATRLKPNLQLEFSPDRAVVTATEVLLQFDVVIINNGSAPARDVLAEAILVSAHAGQDADIAAFFQKAAGTGDRMATIPPLGRVALKSAVRLPIDRLHIFEMEGRRLFVPLVAFTLRYRHGAGEGQAGASYLVGRGTDTDEKLAPFRIDLGPRIFRGLSARPHSMGLAG